MLTDEQNADLDEVLNQGKEAVNAAAEAAADAAADVAADLTDDPK